MTTFVFTPVVHKNVGTPLAVAINRDNGATVATIPHATGEMAREAHQSSSPAEAEAVRPESLPGALAPSRSASGARGPRSPSGGLGRSGGAGGKGALELLSAHAAEGFGRDVELHVTGQDRRHLMAAMRNTNYYEMGLLHPKLGSNPLHLYKDGYRDGIDAIDEQGCVDVPEGPGLGVEYDWDFILAHRTDSAVYK